MTTRFFSSAPLLLCALALLLGACGDSDDTKAGEVGTLPTLLECTDDTMCQGNPAGPLCDLDTSSCVPQCLQDAQCAGLVATPVCDSAAKRCVAPKDDVSKICTSNASCQGDAAGPVCDLVSGACGPGCMDDTGCVGDAAGPVCEVSTGLCKEVEPPPKCTSNASCQGDAAGPVCDLVSGTCGPGCMDDAGCVGDAAGPVCDLASGACGPGCMDDAGCVGDAAGPVCDLSTGLCKAGCLEQKDCTDAAFPYCDLDVKQCAPLPAGSLLGVGDDVAQSVSLDVIYTSTFALETTDLGFHKERDELWLVHRRPEVAGVCAQSNPGSARCQSMGGLTTTIKNPGTSEQSARRLEDGNSWHFMRRPPAIAMGTNDMFATCGEASTANFEDSPVMFIGPTLWTSDLAIYAQPSDGNGSHMDMLHATPWCMGIAHERDNVYWVFNGHVGSIDRYDFHADHGPGADDHSDGEIFRYTTSSPVKRVPNVPSHMAYRPQDKHLYVVDTGNARLLKLDTESGTQGDRFSPVYEPLAASGFMEGAQFSEVVTTGLSQPSGLALTEDAIYVSDHATGMLHAFDFEGKLLRTLDTGLGAGVLAGIDVGSDGRLWFAHKKTGVVYAITRK